VRTSGPWNVYAVADSELVVPLAVQPVVVAQRDGDPRERNLELGMSWFQHQDEWSALPADDGPADWQRIEVAPDLAQRQDDRVDIVTPVDAIDPKPLPAVTVSEVDLGDQDLSFHVDQVGVPVLVRMSYFPNWQVEGAEGPYRVAPNLMVVVPTSNDVHLSFERSGLDVFAYVLTFLGIGALVFWRWRGDAVFAADRPRSAWAATGGWLGRDDDDLDLDFDDGVDPDRGGHVVRTSPTASTAASTDHAYARWRPGNADPTTPMSEPDLEVELSQPATPPPVQPPQVAGDDPDRL
jgi:hypothetical protein